MSWNVAHQTRDVAIAEDFWTAVSQSSPPIDILCFNEYVHGERGSAVWSALTQAGFKAKNIAVSGRVGVTNQVLVASKQGIVEGDLRGPSLIHGSSNFVHVKVSDADIELVALRVPYYESSADTTAYWDELSKMMMTVVDRPIVFVGDLNADPRYKTPGGKKLVELQAGGWRLIPNPGEGWSFCSRNEKVKTCIDYALVSPSVKHATGAYAAKLGDFDLAGTPGSASDHAALMLDLK